MKIFWFILNVTSYVIRTALWLFLGSLILLGTYYHDVQMQIVGLLLVLVQLALYCMFHNADIAKKIIDDYYTVRGMKRLIDG